MSSYLYAVIPYKSNISVSRKEPYPCIVNPFIPELKGIDSEFADSSYYDLFADFLLINTCYRLSAFSNNKDGYCWIRDEICQIAKALGANEVWYVEELITDEMVEWDFSFDDWVECLKNEKKQYVAELTLDVLKGKSIYSYYHDDFKDVIKKSKDISVS